MRSRYAAAILALLLLVAGCGNEGSTPLDPAAASLAPDAAPEPTALDANEGKAGRATAELQGQVGIYHVAITGSDANPGTKSAPFRTVQKAVNVAAAGSTVLVHAGTYSGRVVVTRRSNRADAPVVVRAAGDGTATLTANLQPTSCSSRTPATDRTVQILGGSDYWTFENLTIVGGVYISGTGKISKAQLHSRSLPGRGSYDPEAAKRVHAALGADPAYGIVLRNNKVLRRGVHSTLAPYGTLVGNEVANIDCGVGAAVWINNFSDGWRIQGNYVHDMQESVEHWMNEGIRLGRSSAYSLVENNRVENMPGKGRGFSADVLAGWNTFRSNRASRNFIGFNDQYGPWGNFWIGNVSEANRRAGFMIFLKGQANTAPTDGTPAYVQMICNESRDEPISLLIGGVQKSRFERNAFPVVKLSKGLQTYWTAAGNTWGTSGQLSAVQPSTSTNGCDVTMMARM